MTFTKTPPTTPGFYAWRRADDCVFAVKTYEHSGILYSGGVAALPVSECGGEWCRLVPAEEVERAWDEGFTDPHHEIRRHHHPNGATSMSQCKKCGGNGWLWWFELEDYDGPALENGNDDTRYLCYECGTEPRESTSETVPKSSPMKTKSEKSPPNLVARTGIEPVCDAPEIETIVANQQVLIPELGEPTQGVSKNRPQTVPTSATPGAVVALPPASAWRTHESP